MEENSVYYLIKVFRFCYLDSDNGINDKSDKELMEFASNFKENICVKIQGNV